MIPQMPVPSGSAGLIELGVWAVYYWLLWLWLRGRRRRSAVRLDVAEIVIQGQVVGVVDEKRWWVIAVRPLSSMLLGGSSLPFPAPVAWLVIWHPRTGDWCRSGDWVHVVGTAKRDCAEVKASRVRFVFHRLGPDAPPHGPRGGLPWPDDWPVPAGPSGSGSMSPVGAARRLPVIWRIEDTAGGNHE